MRSTSESASIAGKAPFGVLGKIPGRGDIRRSIRFQYIQTRTDAIKEAPGQQ
jgi:hypothetical protein